MPQACARPAAGLGRVAGAEGKVEGVAQGDRLGTAYARLTASHFVAPATQLQLQLGRDLSVRSGSAEKARVNLRLMQRF